MKPDKMPSQRLFYSIAAAAVLAASALGAHAQDELVTVETAHSPMFINGGIGKGGQEYMSGIARDWPLRLVFSARKDNEYVADVRLLVTDTRGVPFLDISGAGPITYVKLPPGQYRIAASRNGKVETRAVTLDGKADREVFFHWQGGPKS
jgi:hypothetical protein